MDLPLDLTFDILSRTNLSTLAKCRLVCNIWKKLTYDSSFIKSHYTNTTIGCFLCCISRIEHSPIYVSPSPNTPSSPHPSLYFLPLPHVFILASSQQGLLCCLDPSANHLHSRYIICKPCTEQFRILPAPRTRFSTLTIAIVVLRASPLHYNLLRLSRSKTPAAPHKPTRYVFEVFDSEKWRWELGEELVLNRNEYIVQEYAAVANGRAHWMTCDGRVLFFDVVEKKWGSVVVPLGADGGGYECTQVLVECEGSLGYLQWEDRDCMRLWVMEKKMNNFIWVSRYLPGMRGQPCVDAPVFRSEVSIFVGNCLLLCYRFCEKGWRIVYQYRTWPPSQMASFRSDMEMVDL